jgi:hypothetical protein
MVYRLTEKQAFEQARRTHATVRGFINYLDKYKSRMENPTVEP